jgi:ATP-dependent Clp protease protease subunit
MADESKKSASLKDNGIYLFMTEVDEDSCRDAISFILEANLEEDPGYDHLTLIFSSPGGSCWAGQALLDVMSGSRLPVHTVGIGVIASMGLLLFMAGKKGHRILTPQTMIMSHQYASWTFGKEHELVATNKKHQMLSEICMKHYRKYTGLKDKQIREFLLPAHDVWLTAEDCLKLGICDEIRLKV